MQKLSVLIITFNEEAHLARTLDSVSFASEIILVDSLSQDRTLEIARKYPQVKIFERPFAGYGQQKNFALDQCTHPWVLWIDADEALDSTLQKSIQKILENDFNSDSPEGYALNRKTYFLGRWMRHGGWYPDRILRLFRKDAGRFTEPPVHEVFQLRVPGPHLILPGHIEHRSFPTLRSQVQTNIKYAELGSQALYQRKGKPSLGMVLLRPPLKFLECYFWKRGFLDGPEGLLVALNASYSQFLKYALAFVQGRKSR